MKVKIERSRVKQIHLSIALHLSIYLSISLSSNCTCLRHNNSFQFSPFHTWKNKGVGHEAQLICVVHAEPQAHVIWYKETTQIGTTEQLSQQVNSPNRIVCCTANIRAVYSAHTYHTHNPIFHCALCVWEWVCVLSSGSQNGPFLHYVYVSHFV